MDPQILNQLDIASSEATKLRKVVESKDEKIKKVLQEKEEESTEQLNRLHKVQSELEVAQKANKNIATLENEASILKRQLKDGEAAATDLRKKVQDLSGQNGTTATKLDQTE